MLSFPVKETAAAAGGRRFSRALCGSLWWFEVISASSGWGFGLSSSTAVALAQQLGSWCGRTESKGCLTALMAIQAAQRLTVSSY